MSARPCSVSLCVCPGSDSPITNVSAEAPDPLLFWGQIWNPYDPFAPPRLGDGLDIKVDCGPVNDLIALYNPIVYAGTQLLANLEALAASLGCPWPPSGDETFANDAQTATVYCPEGTAFTYTVEAGTLVSPPMDATLGAAWLAWANAWAAAYAYQQASALLDCIVPDDDIPDEPGENPPTIPLGAGILPGPVWLCFGEAFFHRYTVSGFGSSGYTLSITGGALPPGTTFVQDGARTCYITGTPTLPGIYSYTITGVSTGFPATNVSVTDYVYIMGITNADSLPDAETGTAYSEALTAVGGTAPYTYALDTGSTLPGGLTLATDGTISGTPTEDGDFTFDVVFTDANGGDCVQTVFISIAQGGCVDFDAWVWTTDTFTTSGNGYGHSTALPGGEWDFLCGVLTNLPANQATATRYGYAPYVGNGCSVNLHYVLARVGDTTKICGQLDVAWAAAVGGPWTTLYTLNINAAGVDGTFDIPIAIPDTGGATWYVRIQNFAQAKCLAATGLPQEITLTGALTNL